MTTQDITALRLAMQGIAPAPRQSPEQVVHHMGAMQAQDYYGSLWALGVRTGWTQAEIVRAIEEQKIIRTWPQRGTLHLVPPEDATWLVGLSADRLLKGATRRREALGLDDHTLATSKTVLTQALQGKLLTRPEVMDVLEHARISTKSGHGYHILWYLSQTGVTYIGPMKAKQQTIGLLEELALHPTNYSREQGIAELARRYFTSHGPATLQDFIWWTGLTSADAKAGLAANESLLTPEQVDGKTYWLPNVAPAPSHDKAFLLPGFDEYMLGYKDRSAALTAEHAAKVVPGGNGMFLPTIVIRGQVVGTWKRTIRKDHVELALTSFLKLNKADMQLLEEPAAAFGAFIELPPTIVLA